MRRLCFLVFLSLGLLGVRVGFAGQPVSAAAVSECTVELLRVSLCRPLPDDVLVDGQSMTLGNTGLELTVKVKGPGISDITPEGVRFNPFRTRSGQEFLVTGNAGGLRAFPVGRDTDGGRIVTIGCPYPVRPHDARGPGAPQPVPLPLSDIALDDLEISGSLTMLAADGTETLRTGVLDLTKKSGHPIHLDGYEIRCEGETRVRDGGMFPVVVAPHVQDAGIQVPDVPVVGVTLRGKLEDVTGVDVVSNGKKLRVHNQGAMFDLKQFGFIRDGDGHGVIEVHRWKNPRKVDVPFRFRLAPDPNETKTSLTETVPAGYSTELLGIAAGRPVSAGILPPIAFGLDQTGGAGFRMTFLLRGPDIVEVKPFDGIVDVLRTADGRDLRLRDGKLNSAVRVHSFAHVHLVEVDCGEPLLGALDGIQAAGTVKVVVARDQAALTSDPVDCRQPGSLTLGDWTITYGTVNRPPVLVVSQPSGADQPPNMVAMPMDDELQVSAAGGAGRLIDIELLVDGKPAPCLGFSSGFALLSIMPVPVPTAPTAPGTPTLAPQTYSYRPPGDPAPSVPAPVASPWGSSPPLTQVPPPMIMPRAAPPTMGPPQGGFPVPMASPFGPGVQPPAPPSTTFRFAKPNGRAVIRVNYWKESTEIRIPFRHNLPAAQRSR